MKRYIGCMLIVINGASNGHSVALSLQLTRNPAPSVIKETELPLKDNTSLSQSDIEGIENILGAFAQMIGNFAHAMANPQSSTAAATAISGIITNAVQVIIELAKHKNHLIDAMPITYLPSRISPNGHYTLEAMEKELNAKHSEFDPSTQAIVTTFAGMVGNFANIVADPHNPNVVGSNIANLLAGMINIAVQATRYGILNEDSTAQDLEELLAHNTPLIEALASHMQYHAARVRLLRLCSESHA